MLQAFDGYAHGWQSYMDLAWGELGGTRSWNEQVSSSDSTRIRQTYQGYPKVHNAIKTPIMKKLLFALFVVFLAGVPDNNKGHLTFVGVYLS